MPKDINTPYPWYSERQWGGGGHFLTYCRCTVFNVILPLFQLVSQNEDKSAKKK